MMEGRQYRYRLLCLGICSAFFVTMATSCKCAPPTYKLYCSADYVMEVMVKKEVPLSGNPWLSRAYKMCVKRMYKFTGNVTDVDMSLVYTSQPRGACGVTLKPGRYLLSGDINTDNKPHKFSVITCNFYKKWKKLTRVERNFIENPVCP